MIPGTIIPWLLGGLVFLAFLTLSITVKSWREAKRSPYFFLRVQAAKRMQSYLAATLGLLLVALATAAYAWRAPEDSTLRVAVLSNAKPLLKEMGGSGELESAEVIGPETVEISLSPVVNSLDSSSASLAESLPLQSTLPEEFDQFEPTIELKAKTKLGEVAFSTKIDGDYLAIDPARRFGEGFYTLYATFSYDGMADGMVWSWVWRRNGQIIDGGNQVWSYGESGPGYVYFRPEEGFQLGQYTLELWVNGELTTQANLMITDGISASN